MVVGVLLHIAMFLFHHHHVRLPARISLTLSRYLSLSFIAPGRSSRLHPISAQSYFILVLAGCPAFARPCERGPQENIACEFVLTSLAMSRMSGSFNLDSFFWWEVVGRTAAVLWGVASRKCSIQLAAILCNCHEVFSPYVLLASIWCI